MQYGESGEVPARTAEADEPLGYSKGPHSQAFGLDENEVDLDGEDIE